FQAEVGMRDGHVTGVQTCALPISRTRARPPPAREHARRLGRFTALPPLSIWGAPVHRLVAAAHASEAYGEDRDRHRGGGQLRERSEERRVGKEGRRGRTEHKWRGG